MADGAMLAGRLAELGAVSSMLTEPSPCAGLLVAGEAGVGKSRLMAAAAARAAEANVLVLPGWCLALSDGLPFLPIIEALRALNSAEGGRWMKEGLSVCAPPVRGELARLLPELGDVGDVPPADGSIGGIADAWQRQRLFDAVRQVLAAAGEVQRIAVLIEDLHWADATTLAFLDFLLSPGVESHVRLLLTCRSEETVSASVGDWLERAQRNPRVSRLDLAPLTEAETGEQIALLLGHRPSPALVRRVYARSEGNAFFTEQLVTATSEQDADAALPAGLTALLLARTSALTGEAREVVAALAVAGVPLTEGAIAQVCERPVADVRQAIRDLAGRRLLRRPDGSGCHQLRHALLAEAVIADLLPGERADGHARVARLLADRDDPAVAAHVAAHLAAADRPDEELRWRITAARHADAIFAAAEAAAQWRRALELCRDAPPTFSVGDMTLAQIYCAAEDALELSGSDDTANRALAEEAVRRLRDVAPADRADVLRRAGWIRVRTGRADGLDLLLEARELYRRMPPCSEHVQTLELIRTFYVHAGRNAEAEVILDEAAEIAQRAGSRYAYLRIRGQLASRDSTDRNAQELLGLRDGLTEADGPELQIFFTVMITHVLAQLGHLDQAVTCGRPILDLAARYGRDEAVFVAVIRSNIVESLIELGSIDAAADLVDRLTEQTPDPGTQLSYELRAHLETLRGNQDEAHRRWGQLRDIPWMSLAFETSATPWQVELDLWSGVPARAMDRAHRLLVRLVAAADGELADDMRGYAAALLVLAMRGCADCAELARARRDVGDLSVASSAAADLHALRKQLTPDPFAAGPARPTAVADAHSWQAEDNRAAGHDDPAAWDMAARAWEKLTRPHRAAYARWRQAEALLALRGTSRTTAASVLRQAARQADGHVPLSTAIADVARRSRIDLAEPSHGAAPVRARLSAGAFGLSDRELAVLRLVADGRTNAEIGATLYISTKTASVHVTHILRKLDVATRVQAAALAERAGLLLGSSQPSSPRSRADAVRGK